MSLLGVSLWQASAYSQTRATDAPALNWVRLTGAESCISPQALAIKVERRLGRDVFVSSAAAEFAVEGYIRPSENGGWIAQLSVTNRAGEVLGSRELASDREQCNSMDDALALVIAVTLYPQTGFATSGIPLPEEVAARLDHIFSEEPTDFDPELRPDASHSISEGVLQSPYRKEGLPRAASGGKTDSISENNESNTWNLGLAVVGGLGLGMTPKPSVGFGLLARFETPAFWPLDFRANYWYGQTENVSRSSSISISLLAIDLGLCPISPKGELFDFRLCGGLEVGAIITSSKGFANNSINPLAPLGGVYTGSIVSMDLVDPVDLWVGASLVVPVVRQRLVYVLEEGEEPQNFFTQGVINGKFEIGLDTTFF
ncbi:MAG: hypothetical protein JXA30_16690 [Deltaproteobacteria bacterium]|nr:hypothetical protein [Deltaproteobacteria bacterium]